jgi:hypothetical protein
MRALNSTISKQLTEIEHLNSLSYEKDEDYKRFMMNYENNRKGMELNLKKAFEELDLYR